MWEGGQQGRVVLSMGACFSAKAKAPKLHTSTSVRNVELLNGRYQVVKRLGSGSTATVFLAKDVKHGGFVAIKKIERGWKISEYVEREVLLHHSLSHPNVIAFREVFVSGEHLCIVLDYANGGDLVDYMNKHGSLSEDEIRVFFKQLIAAMTYCHSQEVVNRDIKLENILVSHNDGKITVKLADFGFSKYANDNVKTLLGTLGSCAPEIFNYADRKVYDGKKVDIWSSGVCLYRLLFGKMPFEEEENHADATPEECMKYSRDHAQRIMDCDVVIPTERTVQTGPSKQVTVPVSETCQAILKGILALQENRWSLEEICKSDWMRDGEEEGDGNGNGNGDVHDESLSTPESAPVANVRSKSGECWQTKEEIKMVLHDARFGSKSHKRASMRVGTLGKISEVPSELSNPESVERRAFSLTSQQSVSKRVLSRVRAEQDGSMTP